MAAPDSAARGSATARFEREGYAVLEGAIPRRDADRYVAYAMMQRQHPDYYLPEPQHKSVCRYGDALGEALLGRLRAPIEACTGIELFPCYSYLRIYSRGSILARHIDRPACEVSATLTIGGDAAKTWPICLADKDGRERSVPLEPGDLLVYRGSDLAHWRDALDGDYWVQLFLHYVSVNGPFAHHRFDGRRALGELQNRKQQDRNIELRKEYDARLAAGDDPACFCNSGQRYDDCHGITRHTPTA